MVDDLRTAVIAAAGGEQLWNSLRRLEIDVAIGRPFWAMKGWPAETTFDQTVLVDTRREHVVFVPFVQPGHRMVFDAASDSAVLQTDQAQIVGELKPAGPTFTGLQCENAWDTLQVGYFLGYACWNYFTTPFLFSLPDVIVSEMEPWPEAGQTWRRLSVRFPDRIVTHSREQVFYFDADGLQRRVDYAVDINEGRRVGHYTSEYRDFGGLRVATRRRVFSRNPDNTVDDSRPSITLDVLDVRLRHR